MASSIHDIQRLCETAWRGLAEAPKSERHRLAERFLSMLGWSSPDPLSLVPFGVPIPTVSYLLHVNGKALAAHFVSPGVLEPPGALVQRGLDYCDGSRLLVDVTGAVGAQYAFITDLQRSCLYDVDRDELLLHADVPAEFAREFGTILAKHEVAKGSLDDVRRQPRSFVARQLREWCHRWTQILVQQARLPEEKAQLVIDRLLVLRYLFYHDILNPEEWDLENRVADMLLRALSDPPRGAGRMLCQLFNDLWTDWGADIFRRDNEVEAAIQQDRFAGPLLREYALLSQSKFSLLAILESFNYGDAAEKLRVRTIPEDHPGRSTYLARQTVDTLNDMRIELDIDEEGYRTIFYWFDKIVDVLERLEVDFKARGNDAASRAARDLLDFGERRSTPSLDKFRHVVENGLIVYYANAQQFRVSRLLLYLYVISAYEESEAPFRGFPDFAAALQPRPRILESDRQRIYGSNPARYTEEWEVI